MTKRCFGCGNVYQKREKLFLQLTVGQPNFWLTQSQKMHDLST